MRVRRVVDRSLNKSGEGVLLLREEDAASCGLILLVPLAGTSFGV